VRREPLEHAPRRRSIARAHALERLADGGFHRAAAGGIGAGTARRQAQDGAPAIAAILDAQQQPLRHEALQHASEGARVHMQDGGEVSGRNTGKESDDAERQSLWPVTPMSPAIRFEVFSSPCPTAHSNCMNWSTSGRSAPASS
jgi:hypothetical protein